MVRRGYRYSYKYFNYTFKYLGQDITVSCKGRYDGYERHTRHEALDGMLSALRSVGIMTRSCPKSAELVEVKRKEMFYWEDTLAQIKQAEENFKNLPSSIDKLVIAMANANGVTI